MGKRAIVIIAVMIIAFAAGFYLLTQNKSPLSAESRQFYDEVLGHLVLNRENEWWSTRIVINNNQAIELSIKADEHKLGKTLKYARAFFLKTKKSDTYFRNEAANHLVDVYNQNWNAGKVIVAETFKRRLALKAIFIYSTGEAQLFYNDGGMFSGHIIVIDIDRYGRVIDADIAG